MSINLINLLVKITTAYGISLMVLFAYLVISWKFCLFPWHKETEEESR